MGAIYNLISASNASFLSGIGSWTVSSGSATVAHTREFIRHPSSGSMRLTAANTSPVTLKLSSVSTGDDFDNRTRFFVWVYAPRQITVTLGIDPSDLPSSFGALVVPGLNWSLCSIDGPELNESTTFDLYVTFAGLHTSDVVYMSEPTVILPDLIANNLFASETWIRLPEFMRDADEAQTEPDLPLLRFIDVLTSASNDVAVLWDGYRYIPPENGGENEPASLLDPSVASIETIRWLAQILGVKLFNPTSGTTSWYSLESGLDPDGSPEWDDWETVPDTGDAGTDVSWDEIETFEPGGLSSIIDLLRWQVAYPYFGYKAGSKEAIVESVKQLLSGDRTVTFVTMVSGDAWKFKVQTKQSETPGSPSVGDSVQQILDIAENAMPAGFELVHEVVAG